MCVYIITHTDSQTYVYMCVSIYLLAIRIELKLLTEVFQIFLFNLKTLLYNHSGRKSIGIKDSDFLVE